MSTAEKQEIHKDPAVQNMLSLFGGEVIDIRRDVTAAAVDDNDRSAESGNE